MLLETLKCIAGSFAPEIHSPDTRLPLCSQHGSCPCPSKVPIDVLLMCTRHLSSRLFHVTGYVTVSSSSSADWSCAVGCVPPSVWVVLLYHLTLQEQQLQPVCAHDHGVSVAHGLERGAEAGPCIYPCTPLFCPKKRHLVSMSHFC